MKEKIADELAHEFITRSTHASEALRLACLELIAINLEDAEKDREIDRLKAKISAGFIRKDISHHYHRDWKPKKPIPDALTDEWVATGREA